MLCFSNPGEIDVRLITTLGTNVKTSSHPIGFFGTGLKYAISILLRTGHKIEILSGTTRHTFELEYDTIKDKEFGFIKMRTSQEGCLTILTPLAFTTEFGKTWEVWQAYRELLCNALDEGGDVHVVDDESPIPIAGFTQILVSGQAILMAHRERGNYFLSSTPLSTSDECEVHPGPGGGIFYRGIRVGTLQTAGRYIYNITSQIVLSEDRTIKNMWEVLPMIARAIVQSPNEEVVRNVVTAPREQSFEGSLNYDYGSVKAVISPTFEKVVGDLSRKRNLDINPSAKKILSDKIEESTRPEELQLSVIQAKMLERALKFAASIGFHITHKICVSEGLGRGVLGTIREDEIWLSSQVFDGGTKKVAGTIIEEHIHLVHQLADCSYPMQNFLLDKMVSLGEELGGEPL